MVVTEADSDESGEYTMGTTTGKFHDYEVKFSPGKDDFSDSEIEAVIEINSIDTGNSLRDDHLRAESFFFTRINIL